MIADKPSRRAFPVQGAVRPKPETPVPDVALLSNGRYSIMITAAGAGSSSWRDLDVTRWREDATRDCWGQFIYVRDLTDGALWSIGRQPLCRAIDEVAVCFHPDRAEFRRRDNDIETCLAICVAPDQDAEVRLVTFVNHGARPREFDLTSYTEVCLSNRRTDQAAPAFAKLFLETEFLPGPGALIARRRPRGADEKQVWAIHVTAMDNPVSAEVEYETDRARFLGRGRTPANPAALDTGCRLSGTTGAVLDPVFSLRRRVRLSPGGTARIAFVTGAAENHEGATTLAQHFRELDAASRAFDLARESARKELRELDLTSDDIAVFNQLASAVVFTGPALRRPDANAANLQGQPGLWRHAISGDRPIVLAIVATAGDEPLVHQLMRWHAYARRRGLDLDLVILDQRSGDAVARLKTDLQASCGDLLLGKPGGVFILAAAKIPKDDAVLLAAAARAVLGGGHGTLAEQLLRRPEPISLPPPLSVSATSAAPEPGRPAAAPPEGLLFWNGRGGFTPDGREYFIMIDGTLPGGPALPPAPWANVLANPGFGCLVTEAGLGCSWAGNSQLNRLTPWNNDPVSDAPAEAVYLRDEESGEIWSPTPLPAGAGSVVRVRHGQGYTCYTSHSHGLEQELLVFVPPDDPVKLVRLSVRNNSDRPRRLSATFYAEWVLGTVRENASAHVVCEYDAGTGAVLARSAWAGDFAGRIAFVAVGPRPHSATADRSEFLGRNGSPSAPAALQRSGLSGRAGPLLDPCAALLTPVTLAPGQAEEVVFVLGQADTMVRLRDLVTTYTAPGQAREALQAIQGLWDRRPCPKQASRSCRKPFPNFTFTSESEPIMCQRIRTCVLILVGVAGWLALTPATAEAQRGRAIAYAAANRYLAGGYGYGDYGYGGYGYADGYGYPRYYGGAVYGNGNGLGYPLYGYNNGSYGYVYGGGYPAFGYGRGRYYYGF